MILREALSDWKEGVTIGGMKINNLCFADDTILCAKSEQEMSQLMKLVGKKSKSMDC